MGPALLDNISVVLSFFVFFFIIHNGCCSRHGNVRIKKRSLRLPRTDDVGEFSTVPNVLVAAATPVAAILLPVEVRRLAFIMLVTTVLRAFCVESASREALPPGRAIGACRRTILHFRACSVEGGAKRTVQPLFWAAEQTRKNLVKDPARSKSRNDQRSMSSSRWKLWVSVGWKWCVHPTWQNSIRHQLTRIPGRLAVGAAHHEMVSLSLQLSLSL